MHDDNEHHPQHAVKPLPESPTVEEHELWLSGSKASRRGWVRVSDGTERVFYHSIGTGKITLERPDNFGTYEPTWADGTQLYMYRGSCSRCKDFAERRSSAGPVALSADRGQVALSFLLCRPCLNWLVESAWLEREGKPPIETPRPPPEQKIVLGRGGGSRGGGGGGDNAKATDSNSHQRKKLVKICKNVDLTGAGDLLANSRLARGYAKCMYSRLSEQTLRRERFDEQRTDCLKAKAAAVVAGEERRRAARATKMKLRCISEFGSHGGGDYLCWFSPEGRVDYFGESSGGRAHGWGLAEYQDGSWCLSFFSHGQQHTPEGRTLSTLQYANGNRYHGEMKKGKPHGKGTKTWLDETEYTGEFYLGKEHGEGTKKFPDGSEHSGTFRAGVRDGPGVFIDAWGQKTAGKFRDDLFGKADDEDDIVAPAGGEAATWGDSSSTDRLVAKALISYCRNGGDDPCLGSITATEKADITIESGQFDPQTLVDLAVTNLAVVIDRQPALYKASLLLAKMPLHLHPLVAAAFASRARDLSAGFRASLPSFAWCAVSEVRVCNTRLLPVDMAKLSYFLEAIPGLKKLSVIACKLSGDAIAPIADIIATSNVLEEVDLSWNPIRREGVRAVISALEASPRLRRLCLAGCQLGGNGGQAIIAAMGADRDKFRLLDLDISLNSLGPGSGRGLAAALRRNKTLTRLSLRANGLGPEGGKLLAAGVASNCGSLKELVVADNRLGPAVATLVAASMRGGTSQCLHGFGFQSPHHQDNKSSILESACSACSDGSGPPLFEGGEAETGGNKKELGGMLLTSSSSSSSISSSSGCTGSVEDVGKAVVPRTGRRRPQQTAPDMELSSLSTPSLKGGSTNGGCGGRREKRRPSRRTPSPANVTAAAAFEQVLGRPQTAGTASG